MSLHFENKVMLRFRRANESAAEWQVSGYGLGVFWTALYSY